MVGLCTYKCARTPATDYELSLLGGLAIGRGGRGLRSVRT